jgi:hypothetical protein
MQKIYITGRYNNQIKSVKKEVLLNSKLDWELVDDPNDSQNILFFDHIEESLLSLSGRKILIRQEPKMVLPHNYLKKNLKKFDLVIDVGVSKKLNSKAINWPQNIKRELASKTKREKSKAVLINSNLISLDNDELYSLRRTVAYKSNKVDLYGHGWNNGIKKRLKSLFVELKKFIKHPLKININGIKFYFKNQTNYKGSVENKHETMQKYSVALVIENCLNYVSEKLFDSFSARCIPIYIGPNLVEYEIPKNLYIQSEPSYEGISKAIENALKIDFERWVIELNEWLSSDICKQEWSEETFLMRLKILIDS